MVVQLAQHACAISCLHQTQLTVAMGEANGECECECVDDAVSDVVVAEYDDDPSLCAYDCGLFLRAYSDEERAWLLERDDFEERVSDGSGRPEKSRRSGIIIVAYKGDGMSCQWLQWQHTTKILARYLSSLGDMVLRGISFLAVSPLVMLVLVMERWVLEALELMGVGRSLNVEEG
jgi:hypothetical protein